MASLELLAGSVVHMRYGKTKHSFRYSIFYSAFDLSQLQSLDQSRFFFSLNRFNWLSLRNKDYLDDTNRPILQKLQEHLDARGLQSNFSKVLLVTSPRYLGVAFNPVSFYFCYDASNELQLLVAEVNNTFSEKHLYFVNPRRGDQNESFSETQKKTFFVSPFFDVSGEYNFKFCDLKDGLDVQIDLIKEGQKAFHSRVRAQPKEYNSTALLKQCFTMPFAPFMTYLRIMWQAANLHFKKGLQVNSKPKPSSTDTIQSKPHAPLEKLGFFFVRNHLSKCKNSSLKMILPDGSELLFGQRLSNPAILQVNHFRMFKRCLLAADIGFGESYQEGEWDSPHLEKVFEFFIANSKRADHRKGLLRKLSLLPHVIQHRLRANTKSQSKHNISAHYDLGNPFYEKFLDKRMIYSCGYFWTPADDLDVAQVNKIQRFIDLGKIRKEHHVLEIGCGWGGLAIEAVKRTGCRWTGITISKQQLFYAQEKVKQAGLEDKIEFLLEDYRNVNGGFDRVVSCEMLEAVGHEHFDDYFSCIERVLAHDGIAVIQVITIPDQRYERYRMQSDWIQKYIFPGALLPSLTALSASMTRSSSLFVQELQNIGPHYAETLRQWYKRFQVAKPLLDNKKFDQKFCRIWDYYLKFCEAAFEARYLNDLQLVLTRDKNKEFH